MEKITRKEWLTYSIGILIAAVFCWQLMFNTHFYNEDKNINGEVSWTISPYPNLATEFIHNLK